MSTETQTDGKAATAPVLIVDDRQHNILALEVLLAPLGVDTDAALSGAEALHKLLHRDYAVILLDVQMPELDGFATAQLIRGRKRSEKTPIIFVTAIDRADEHERRGYALGAVDYLFKPIVADVLLSKVRVFCDLFDKSEALARQAAQLEAEVSHFRALAAPRAVAGPLDPAVERKALDEYAGRLGEFLGGTENPDLAKEVAARLFHHAVSGRQFVDIHLATLERMQSDLTPTTAKEAVQRARLLLVAVLAHLAEAYQNPGAGSDGGPGKAHS